MSSTDGERLDTASGFAVGNDGDGAFLIGAIERGAGLFEFFNSRRCGMAEGIVPPHRDDC
jgi:hypothetical protein